MKGGFSFFCETFLFVGDFLIREIFITMGSFALVYFKEDRSYSAVAVASLKTSGEKLTKGSQVIVLGTSFDPVTNAEKDEEWPATIVNFGKISLLSLLN